MATPWLIAFHVPTINKGTDMKRKDAVRLYNEFGMSQLSTMARGALMALLNYEGERLTEHFLLTITDGTFFHVKNELIAAGCIKVTCHDDRTYTFEHIVTPGEAFRSYDRERKHHKKDAQS